MLVATGVENDHYWFLPAKVLMSRPYTPKVLDLIKYRKLDGRWVGAVVTAVIDALTVDLRVSHAFTKQNVSRMSSREDVEVWALSRSAGTVETSWGWWF